MSRKLDHWTIALGMALSGGSVLGAAEPCWQAMPSPSTARAAAVSLGRPIPAAAIERPEPWTAPVIDPRLAPVGFEGSAPPAPSDRSGVIIRAQAADGPAPVLSGPAPIGPSDSSTTTAGATTTTPFTATQAGAPGTTTSGGVDGSGALPGTPDYNAGAVIDRPLHHSWGEKCRDFFGMGGHEFSFKSDTCFDDSGLISPLSNPFFFEDPRSLTEIRPIYIYQKAPGGTPIVAGGDTQFFGLQGRLALSDSWSIVLNKFGLVHLHANRPEDDFNGDFRSNSTGFAEVVLGPKWTFYRNPGNGAVAAAGLNFDLPIGSTHVFQDVGTLSVDPYVTYAKHFGRSSYGSFNFVGELGYSFGLDDRRSDFFHAALHLDFDIVNAHKWYPILELNYFHYTSSGRQNDFNFEGGDLINFGSTGVNGRDYMSLAPGFRYQFNPHFSAGIAAEFPLADKDLQDFRLTLDLIVRY